MRNNLFVYFFTQFVHYLLLMPVGTTPPNCPPSSSIFPLLPTVYLSILPIPSSVHHHPIFYYLTSPVTRLISPLHNFLFSTHLTSFLPLLILFLLFLIVVLLMLPLCKKKKDCRIN